MKKTILFASALLCAGIFMGSCKKDYTCKCTKTYTNPGSSTTLDYSVYTYKDNRKRAEDRCNENESTGSDIGGGYTINCEIQ
jgi:hypothetical protein